MVAPIEAAASYITEKLTSAEERQDPILALQSLEIDPELITILQPLFAKIGFNVVTDEVYGRSGACRKLVIVKNGGSSLYVISVHKCVLGLFTDATFSAFSMLTYLFGENSTIHIISRDLDAMDVGFDSMLEEWEQSRKVRAVFIPWKWIARLVRENDGKKRFLTFQQIFKLEASNTKTGEQPAAPITAGERDQIVKILSVYASNTLFSNPQEAMQSLVLAADLPDRARLSGAWKGNPEFDSLRLFNFVKDDRPLFPADHSRQGQSTLGWLLKALHDQAIDSENKKTLARIIVDHGLLTDPEVIAALRKEASGS
jgi:hypothetical protein